MRSAETLGLYYYCYHNIAALHHSLQHFKDFSRMNINDVTHSKLSYL